MIPDQLRSLFHRYFEQTATEQEINELMQWLSEQASEEEILQLMDEAWAEFNSTRPLFSTEKSNRLLLHTLQSGQEKTVPAEEPRPHRISWRRIAVAAAILLLLGAGTWFLVDKKSGPSPNQQPVAQVRFKNDIRPATDKAVLTLANGSQIILDDAANGNLSSQGGTQVIKLDGELSYNAVADPNQPVLYNTISTAKGKQYKLVLADGSKVWLNAASSLRFPTSFRGNDRHVTVNGEAYFEIAHQSDKEGKKIPFHVTIQTPSGEGGEIQVMGTHFNISAYDDEAVIKTTLLEGAVVVKRNNLLQRLTPGQQASLPHPSGMSAIPGSRNTITVVNDANVEQAVAWKNNLFDFENETIRDIMRQLARWYDIDVRYEGTMPDKHYFGAIRRQVNISEIFHMLEIAGQIDFSIDGKKVVVRPK